MPFFEITVATGFLAVATGFAAIMSITAKHATDRIASFLPTATVAAYQLILSSYPLKGECSVGQVCSACSSLNGDTAARVYFSRNDGSATTHKQILVCRASSCGSPCGS